MQRTDSINLADAADSYPKLMTLSDLAQQVPGSLRAKIAAEVRADGGSVGTQLVEKLTKSMDEDRKDGASRIDLAEEEALHSAQRVVQQRQVAKHDKTVRLADERRSQRKLKLKAKAFAEHEFHAGTFDAAVKEAELQALYQAQKESIHAERRNNKL